jgi:adenylyltransferase/sulfurtransferase
MHSDFSERYSRQLRLKEFGPEAQQKLTNAKVLVVGAGGLGVPVLQYLAGMGVGTIGIIDDDVVSLSNLHRQVLYRTDDAGRPKAKVAAESLQKLNPHVSLQIFTQRLDVDSALSIIGEFDIVVDATDNFATRYLINDACVILRKPFVYGAVQGYEGHVSVFNLNDGPTYRCLYPTPPDPASVPDCNEAGVLGVVPGIVGTMQALQVVKIICGMATLSGYLQVFDFLNDEQLKLKLNVNPKNLSIAYLQQSYGFASCSNEQHLLQPVLIAQWQNEGRSISLIDVREPHEYLEAHIPSAQNLPLSEFDFLTKDFEPKNPLILYCKKGSRSANAYSQLRAMNPELELYELAGGFEAWLAAQKET